MVDIKLNIILVSIFVVGQCVWINEMENPGMFEGDMQLDPDEKEGVLKGNSYASIKGGRWPGAKIPYDIQSSIGSRGRTAIANAIAQYHKHTCLRFHKRGRESSYISFYRGGGCSSPVGYRRGRRNSISLAGGCWHTGIVMHEIGHSIGIFHEQSRPDRDQYVRIVWNNIQGSMKFNFNKHSSSSIDSLGTPYDFRSMMHYGSTAFGGGRRTIETIDPSNQRLIGQRGGFSQIDIKQINLMYCGGVNPGTKPPIPPTVNPNTGPVPSNLPPSCFDKDENCGHWGSRGWCTDAKEKQWMKDNCCKSCAGAECKDRHSRCQEWANRNPSECQVNPNYMLRVCQTSCKQC